MLFFEPFLIIRRNDGFRTTAFATTKGMFKYIKAEIGLRPSGGFRYRGGGEHEGPRARGRRFGRRRDDRREHPGVRRNVRDRLYAASPRSGERPAFKAFKAFRRRVGHQFVARHAVRRASPRGPRALQQQSHVQRKLNREQNPLVRPVRR